MKLIIDILTVPLSLADVPLPSSTSIQPIVLATEILEERQPYADSWQLQVIHIVTADVA
jgi:hypothetical protein